jgi:hypothetical protein
MTAKATIGKLLEELEALKLAMTEARIARGENAFIVVNDPEEGLEAHKVGLDQTQCVNVGALIGLPDPPTEDEYRAYQQRARSGD